MEKKDVMIGSRPMVRVSCDAGHVLLRRGRDGVTAMRDTVVDAAAAELLEEVTAEEWMAMQREEWREREYRRRLSAAIHERYSIDDEIALRANVDDPELLDDEAKAESVAAEWAEYQAYRKECKARVRAELETEEQKEGKRTEGVLETGEQ